jgi:hypothetical protein
MEALPAGGCSMCDALALWLWHRQITPTRLAANCMRQGQNNLKTLFTGPVAACVVLQGMGAAPPPVLEELPELRSGTERVACSKGPAHRPLAYQFHKLISFSTSSSTDLQGQVMKCHQGNVLRP